MFLLILASGISIILIGLLFLMAAGLDSPLSRSDGDHHIGGADLTVCTVIDLDDPHPRISHTSVRITG